MFPRSTPILVLSTLFIMGLVTSAEEPQQREWTSTAGTKLQAAATAFESGKVTLLGADGRKIEIPIEQLSATDQAYVREQFGVAAPEMPQDGEPVGSGTPALVMEGATQGEIFGPVEGQDGATYYGYLPTNLKTERGAPLLFVTLAGGGKEKTLNAYIPAAERLGFMLFTSVESSNRNSGNKNTPSNYDYSKNSLEHIAENYPVDKECIFFTGASGGGATAMVNATFMEGAGAMPMIGYLHWEHQQTSKDLGGYYYVINGATDFNRYMSADICELHDDDAVHRFHDGAHGGGAQSMRDDGMAWLLGKFLADAGDDYATQKLDYEKALILWIRELSGSEPHRAYEHARFLRDDYGITDHNAAVLEPLFAKLSEDPANARFSEGLAAIDQFSENELQDLNEGSVYGKNTDSGKRQATVLAEEFSGITAIEDIFRELAKPTTEGKKK